MKILLLLPCFLLSASCSSLPEIVTSDNVLRAIEIGENAHEIYRDARAIYGDIEKAGSVTADK